MKMQKIRERQHKFLKDDVSLAVTSTYMLFVKF